MLRITNFWKLCLLCRILVRTILKQDDIEYAIENTQVILAPERQIATFGNTNFEFHLISELMDRVDQVRIRTGRIEAERPKILSPEYFCRMMLEGFGEKAQEYVERLREHARQIAVLRYGFQFRKSGVTEKTVSASLQSVIDPMARSFKGWMKRGKFAYSSSPSK